MINDEQAIEYESYNKIYIPEDYVNQNNKYTLENDTITIITNNNCTTNYNTTYCDCYRYNAKYNLITQSYSCNRNPSNYIIDNNQITTDINYSPRITEKYTNDYIIYFGTIIIAIILTILFKRNSRKL